MCKTCGFLPNKRQHPEWQSPKHNNQQLQYRQHAKLPAKWHRGRSNRSIWKSTDPCRSHAVLLVSPTKIGGSGSVSYTSERWTPTSPPLAYPSTRQCKQTGAEARWEFCLTVFAHASWVKNAARVISGACTGRYFDTPWFKRVGCPRIGVSCSLVLMVWNLNTLWLNGKRRSPYLVFVVRPSWEDVRCGLVGGLWKHFFPRNLSWYAIWRVRKDSQYSKETFGTV